MTELCEGCQTPANPKKRWQNVLVDVDSRAPELAVLVELVQVVNTSGSLFRNTTDVLEHLGVLLVNEGSKISSILRDR